MKVLNRGFSEFYAIESSCTGHKGTLGFFIKETGSRVKRGVRELLNLACSEL